MDKSLTKGVGPWFKPNYLRLIAAGHIERTALEVLEVEWLDFFEICARDPEFRANIEEARKNRADHWVDRVADSIDKKYYIEVENPESGVVVRTERAPSKDEIARDKLTFEKLKFLAQADNPEKYSPGSKTKINVDFDMTDFKLLPVAEARQVLINDPFAPPAIEAEFTESKDKE